MAFPLVLLFVVISRLLILLARFTYYRTVLKLKQFIDEIKNEYERVRNEIQTERSVAFFKRMLLLGVQGIEMMNTKFDPLGVDLDGWSEAMGYSLENQEYDEVMAELYEKYNNSVIVYGQGNFIFNREGKTDDSWNTGFLIELLLSFDFNNKHETLKNSTILRYIDYLKDDFKFCWIVEIAPQRKEPRERTIKFNSKPKRVTFEGNYNAKGSYLPNGEGVIFVHRKNSNFQIALKYFNENFVRALTNSKLDESPSISPNGNVIIYAISENGNGLLAGVTLSGARFRLPIQNGEVREPSWSGFLR